MRCNCSFCRADSLVDFQPELAAAPIHDADGAHDAWDREAEHEYL